VKVHWTTAAQKHLLDIFEYVAADSDVYAQRMVDRLTHRSQQIGEFPMSGRMVPEYELPEIREVIEGPYRIIYRIKPEQIDVLAVVHGSRKSLLPDSQ
jgi:plasmid stabilization system protein ParE